MLSTSYVTKLYFKRLFIPAFGGALLISIILMIIGSGGDNFGLFVLISLLLLGLSYGIPMLLAKMDEKKGNEAGEIFRAEGFTENFCDAYRKAYIESKNNPFAPHLILCASYYEKMGDHNSAQMYLDRVDSKKLDKESKFIYCLEKLMVCGKTGDWSDGEDIRNENIKFIQIYMEKKKLPEYKVQMYIALSLVDCAYKHYADAFSLLKNFDYKPTGANDTNFLNILITAIYIYAKMNDQENLSIAVKNAQVFLSKFTMFEYPWCKEYYENLINRASKGKL